MSNNVGVDDPVDPNKQKYINKPMSKVPTSNIQNLTSNVAITLIALIITIIVLLILAGVTLNMVMGDSGIIDKAKLAKQEYDNASDKEKQDIDVLTNEIYSNATNSREQIMVDKIEYEALKDKVTELEKQKIIKYDFSNLTTNSSGVIELESILSLDTSKYVVINVTIPTYKCIAYESGNGKWRINVAGMDGVIANNQTVSGTIWYSEI